MTGAVLSLAGLAPLALASAAVSIPCLKWRGRTAA
jgi:hypothetical protein